MRIIIKYTILILFFTGCATSVKPTHNKYFLELDDCLKVLFNKSEAFEKFSINDTQLNRLSYVEQGNNVIDLIDLLYQAKKLDLPVILYFNLFACVNCRKIEEQVLNQIKISERLKQDYIFIPLSIDDRTKLSKDQKILLSEDCHFYGTGGELDRIGKVNSYLQSALSKTGSQPYFYAFDSNGELGGCGFVKTQNEFDSFLNSINGRRN